jgi:hypothetical protein
VNPERTRAIREFQPPKNGKGISRFIGRQNFYHKFILDFAKVAAPLNMLRNKGVMFKWELEQKQAFEALKNIPLKRMQQTRDIMIAVPESVCSRKGSMCFCTAL